MRRILAIVLGIAVGIVIVFIGDATVHSLQTPPENFRHMDKVSQKAYVQMIPTYVHVIMLLFWLLAAFLGGMLAARINRLSWKGTAASVGALLLVATLLNLALIPGHPTWMWIAALALFIPTALTGGLLVRPKTFPNSETVVKQQEPLR